MIIDARAGELVEEFVGTGYLAFLSRENSCPQG